MARKLITFLGTGKYGPCFYHLNDIYAIETKFVQEAIIDIYHKLEIPIDEFHILLTKKSTENNWLGEDGLFNSLRKYEQKGLRIITHDISAEQNIDTLWELFETIVNIIEKNDQIVFDITHSFRFQPMLALLSIHFARVTKNILVDGIYYGVYDKDAKVKKFPIIDLTSFVDMQDWITNVYAFTKTGRVEGLVSWIQEKDNEIRREERRTTIDLKLVRQLTKSWHQLMSALQTNRSLDIPKKAVTAVNSIEALKDVMLRPAFLPLNNLLTEVEDDIKPMAVDDPVISGLAAIEWCYKHGLYQQAYTLADELIITAICLKYNLKVNDEDDRNIANDAKNFAIKIHKKTIKHQLDFTDENGHIVQKIIDELLGYPKLLNIADRINDNRNDINHAGWRKQPLSAEKLEEQFDERYMNFRKQILQYYQTTILAK